MGPTRRYRLAERIGEGAHGRVYRAILEEDGGLQKQVAIKVSKTPDPQLLERLQREARTLARLSSDVIVRVEGTILVEDRPAIVMELVLGGSLDELGVVPPRVVIELAHRVAAGLQEAHEVIDASGAPLRLVHRDIKPGNIMLTAQGQVKLIDFGLARPQHAAGGSTTGMIQGTLEFMAPERSRGAPATHRGDLYALGAILMILLRGEPWVTIGGDEVEHGRTLERRLTLLASALGEHGEPVATLVGNLLAFNPEERPEARHLIQDCERLMARLSGPTLAQWARENAALLVPRPPPVQDDLYGLIVGGEPPPPLPPPPPPPPDPKLWLEWLIKLGVKLTALLATFTALVKAVDVFIRTAEDSALAKVLLAVLLPLATCQDAPPPPQETPSVTGDPVKPPTDASSPPPETSSVARDLLTPSADAPSPPPDIADVEPERPLAKKVESRSADVRAVKSPERQAKGAPPSAEPLVEPAKVTLSGDAEGLILRRSGQATIRLSAGQPAASTAPGAYTAHALFYTTGSEEIGLGTITLSSGASVTVSCDESSGQCRW